MTEDPQVKNQQILKSREDTKPVYLVRVEEAGESTKPFKQSPDSESSWLKQNEQVGPLDLRPRIEPWLTALFQSEHLSLLLGAGLTKAVHLLSTQKSSPEIPTMDWGEYNDRIVAESNRSAKASERAKGNIEDQIRSANELLRGLEILGLNDDNFKKNADALRTKISELLSGFADSILQGEQGIVSANVAEREKAFNYLVSFLMSFASRTGTRDRLHIFTTNYDRVIEAGAEAAGMHLLDRFVGTLAPVFRSSRLNLDLHYNPPGIRGEPRYLEGVARFSKLHGSLDWVDRERNIRRVGVPFGASTLKPYLEASGAQPSSGMQLMIYPNAAKDREASAYPYVELFRDFAAATCRPNHTLVVYGYSFGDEHINRVIEDMLTIPSTHLVVISYDDPIGRIMKTYERLGRHAQISLLIGDHIGDFQRLVDRYLPKPAIDRTTFRMAELLKARWDVSQGKGKTVADDNAESGGDES